MLLSTYITAPAPLGCSELVLADEANSEIGHYSEILVN